MVDPNDTQKWPIVFALKKPIEAPDGRTITELTIREPTSGDTMDHGSPLDVDFTATPPKVEINWPRMGLMIGMLADLPQSTIALLPSRTLATLGYRLLPFFAPEAE